MKKIESILVGIDGSERGEHALEWAARLAKRNGARLALLAVVSPEIERAAGFNKELLQNAIETALGEAKAAVESGYPELEVTTSSSEGDIVEALVAASEEHDLVVMGTHHSATLGERVWGAKGLRVSVSTTVPTAVIPVDWEASHEGRGVVVGVGPDDVSDAAVEVGARVALATGQPLELVSAWGVPAILTKPAKIMGGGLEPVGRDFQRNLDARVERLRVENPTLDVQGNAIEGPSPTQVLLDQAKDASLLVLGTHARSAAGRALFGSVTYGALAHQSIPTIVVPQA